MRINQKQWHRCPRKKEARRQTIIDLPRRVLNVDSLPKDQQMWSLCGQCGSASGEPQPGCEFDEVLEAGLLSPRQYHGVDNNQDIVSLNRQAYPSARWYYGDFYEQMVAAKAKGKFRPALVNLDTTCMLEKGVPYLAKVMACLDSVPNPVVLVANFIMQIRHWRTEDADRKLAEQPIIRRALASGKWEAFPQFCSYDGTGDKSMTKMGSFFFLKR